MKGWRAKAVKTKTFCYEIKNHQNIPKTDEESIHLRKFCILQHDKAYIWDYILYAVYSGSSSHPFQSKGWQGHAPSDGAACNKCFSKYLATPSSSLEKVVMSWPWGWPNSWHFSLNPWRPTNAVQSGQVIGHPNSPTWAANWEKFPSFRQPTARSPNRPPITFGRHSNHLQRPTPIIVLITLGTATNPRMPQHSNSTSSTMFFLGDTWSKGMPATWGELPFW